MADKPALVLLWIGLIVAFLSCGSQTQKEEKETALVLKHTRLLGRREGLRPLLDDFERKNPRVKVIPATPPRARRPGTPHPGLLLKEERENLPRPES
jgi:hypothetical protein